MQGYTGDHVNLPVRDAPVGEDTLRTRVISGIFVGILTMVPGVLGGLWFTSLVLIVVLIASYEVTRMMQVSGLNPSLTVGFATTTIAFVVIRFPTLPNLSAIASFVILASVAIQMRRREKLPIADWAVGIAGGLYLGWTSAHLASVRELDNGLWWLVLAIGGTWIADSGAYLVGKRFGKHKLAPVLSPKKTWEGYLGGVGAALLCGAVVAIISPLGTVNSLFAGLLVGLFGTLGDLVESMFKRQANAKDSGHLIPGHGGAFDRIDSLLWAGVIVYYFATFVAH